MIEPMVVAMVSPTVEPMIPVDFGPNLLVGSNAVEDDTDATTDWVGLNVDVFESQAAVTNGSNFAFQTNANTTPLAAARIYRVLTALGLVDGETYQISIDARHVGSGGDWGIYIGASTSGTNLLVKLLTSTDLTYATYTAEFQYGVDFDHIVIRESSATNDGGVYVDNALVRAV